MSNWSENEMRSIQIDQNKIKKLFGIDWLIDAIIFYCTRIRDVSVLSCSSKARRIYVIGDSHSQTFPRKRGTIKVSVGPVTLNRAGKVGECKQLTDIAFSWPSKLRFFHYPKPTKESTIVVSFGEIDFRVHVARESVRQSVSPEVILERLLDSAINVVKQIRDLYGSKIIFLGVVPPTDQYLDQEFPWSGSLAERIVWVNTFNWELDKRLLLHPEFRSRVVDISNGLTNSDGSLNAMFSDGTVHYHSSIGIKLMRCIRAMSDSIS